jgi:hypothetical protein
VEQAEQNVERARTKTQGEVGGTHSCDSTIHTRNKLGNGKNKMCTEKERRRKEKRRKEKKDKVA